MAVRAKREKRERAGKSLNLILWCAFSLFALLVVVVFVLVQNALVVRQYRESALNVLREAGEEMSAEIASSPGPSTRLERRLINIANDYGLTVALFYEGGEPVFDLTEQTDFSAFAAFLQEHADMELIDCNVSFGRCGLPDTGIDVSKVRRIFPMDGGEGHFIAKMKKKGEGERRHLKEVKQSKTDPLAEAFFKGQLKEGDPCVMQQGTKVYARMQPFVVLDGLQVIRQGVLCGEIVKKRFEPHQHFYTAGIHQAKLSHVYEMSLSECEQFLKGYPLAASLRGFVCLCYQGFPLGFGKGDGSWIKNRYPKGLRISEQVKLC